MFDFLASSNQDGGQMHSLRSLTFDSCQLGDFESLHIYNEMSRIHTIQELHIVNMPFGSRGEKVEMQYANYLQLLELRNNFLEDFSIVNEIIIQSKTLTALNIQGNLLETENQVQTLIKCLT